jgi:hypothetical protein
VLLWLLVLLLLLRLGSLLLLCRLLTLLLLLLPQILLLLLLLLPRVLYMLLLPRVRHIPTLPSLTLHLTVGQIHQCEPLHVLLLVVHGREGRVPRVWCDKVHAGVYRLIQGRQLCSHMTFDDSRLRGSSARRPGRLLLLPWAAVPTTSSSRGLIHARCGTPLLPEPATAAVAAAHASWLDCFWSLVKHHELA